jgi:hypothetical protein
MRTSIKWCGPESGLKQHSDSAKILAPMAGLLAASYRDRPIAIDGFPIGQDRHRRVSINPTMTAKGGIHRISTCRPIQTLF